ncbi:hypothetical protein [Neisseria sp. 19428wB4_WF04]|nr:hypothetical protein [Neisseria sp. 19428wB4_WF04]
MLGRSMNIGRLAGLPDEGRSRFSGRLKSRESAFSDGLNTVAGLLGGCSNKCTRIRAVEPRCDSEPCSKRLGLVQAKLMAGRLPVCGCLKPPA